MGKKNIKIKFKALLTLFPGVMQHLTIIGSLKQKMQTNSLFDPSFCFVFF